jgi:hypothetical protein
MPLTFYSRLDLRPQSAIEGEEADTTIVQDLGDQNHLAPPMETNSGDVDASQRRRRSRLLDWNRLRHASVDERIQALRQYRQSQQVAAASNTTTEDQTRSNFADRLRERFHIRTRTQPPAGDSS